MGSQQRSVVVGASAVLSERGPFFDPTAGMIRALGSFLHGKPAAKMAPLAIPKPSLGLLPRLLGRHVLPPVDPQQAMEEDAEAAARWMVACYPRRNYPAIAVGPANGALMHLCAALGIPWLPQSFAVPDRVTGGWRRLVRQGLGTAWSGFLTRCLPRGATILLVGSAAAADPGLLAELLERARLNAQAVVGLRVEAPGDLSPLVADLHAWWYRRRGILARRLLATSWVVTDPLWTFRVGAVPFWLYDLTDEAADGLERYLEARPPFDYISLCLFRPEGAQPAALPPLERWQVMLARAKRRGEGVGVDAASYPADLSSFQRYQDKVRHIEALFPLPGALPLDQFGGFLRYAARYRAAVQPLDGEVRWLGT